MSKKISCIALAILITVNSMDLSAIHRRYYNNYYPYSYDHYPYDYYQDDYYHDDASAIIPAMTGLFGTAIAASQANSQRNDSSTRRAKKQKNLQKQIKDKKKSIRDLKKANADQSTIDEYKEELKYLQEKLRDI